MLVVPKSFSFAQFIYPSGARKQVAFSCGRRGTTVVVDEELPCVKNTSSVSLRLPPSTTGEGNLSVIATSVAVGRITASDEFFDEPTGSACEMPPGGLSQATGTTGDHDC